MSYFSFLVYVSDSAYTDDHTFYVPKTISVSVRVSSSADDNQPSQTFNNTSESGSRGFRPIQHTVIVIITIIIYLLIVSSAKLAFVFAPLYPKLKIK